MLDFRDLRNLMIVLRNAQRCRLMALIYFSGKERSNSDSDLDSGSIYLHGTTSSSDSTARLNTKVLGGVAEAGHDAEWAPVSL